MERKLEDMNDTSASSLKQFLDQKDDAEMRHLEGEKERTRTLVDILVKQVKTLDLLNNGGGAPGVISGDLLCHSPKF